MKQYIRNQEELRHALFRIGSRIIEPGKQYSLEFKELRPQRTLTQNSLYWLWLSAIEIETGNDRNDLHELFKQMFLNCQEVPIFGMTIHKYSSQNQVVEKQLNIRFFFC